MKSSIFLTILALVLSGCSTLKVGYRQEQYKEVFNGLFSDALAKQLGSGYAVTLTEGDNEKLELKGKGFVLGGVAEHNSWIFDFAVGVAKYEDKRYGFSYTGPTSGSRTTTFEINGTSVDLTVGYRIAVIRPYLGLRKLDYSMTTMALTSGSSDIKVSMIQYLGGLSLDLPIPGTKSSFLALAADYGRNATKDDSVESSETIAGTASLNMGF
jgi:hypothetical protein